MQQRCVVWAALLCALPKPGIASADAISVTAGITVAALDGKHDTGTGVDRLAFVPLPLGEVNVRALRTTLHLEGLPPLAFDYGRGPGSPQQTQLSIVNATLRQSLGGSIFAGFGQTVYNQRTSYAADEPNGVARQSSRVTGLRFEAGFARHFSGPTTLEYTFAFNPAMRGNERTALRAAGESEIVNPERAVQIDTELDFVTKIAHGGLIYGLRYLNYASRYDLGGSPFDALLADRNVGFLPSIGYRVRL